MHAQQVLFVEDDVIVRQAASDFLRDRGFRVLEAEGPSPVADLLDRRPYLSGLVTDIDLGEGEDGFAVARQIRAAYPLIPVVFVSAAAAVRHAAEGVEGSQFIQKPYHPRQIIDALCELARPRVAA